MDDVPEEAMMPGENHARSDDAASAARAFYGRWAGLYDWLATGPVVRRWRARAGDALSLSRGETVVEMGCGTGANAPVLRERVGPDGQVVGVDVTRRALARADERIEREGWSNVHLLQADATRPPVRTADAVLATFVTGMLPDPAGAVEEWCDLVGPGGRVALLNFQRTDRPWTRPLAPLFEAFVWLSAPAKGVPNGRPSARLQRRVGAAREGLARRTVEPEYETLLGGYLGLVHGRVLE